MNGTTMIYNKRDKNFDKAFCALYPLRYAFLNFKNANSRMNASDYIGFAMAGVYPDCRALLDYAVGEALKYLKDYRTPIPIKILANQVAHYLFQFIIVVLQELSFFLTFLCK